MSNKRSRGSEWHRWDPHLHAPGTLLSDQFDNDWDGYLDRIEKADPPVRALGVTDYFCIRTYKQLRTHKISGRLPEIDLVFPNVEVRLTIETERRRGLNCHLLFSPDDPEHENQIERILSQLHFEFRGSQYLCSVGEFERLGKVLGAKDQESAIREGANQFKVDFKALKDLFRREDWMKRNCLFAVAAAEGDGTGGLQNDSSFLAQREEIEAFADVIFSGKPSDRDFWLGKKPGFDPQFIEQKYGRIKPCLHGSDAHKTTRVLAPDLDRSCWIKAELSFEGLRQAVIEPEQRVFVGANGPTLPANHESVRSVSMTNASWFANDKVDLNSGLVAIIGARGSGKTALADIIASATCDHLAHADASFIARASTPVNHLVDAQASISWGDGSSVTRELVPRGDQTAASAPRIRYLSQQFVDQLCSSEGLADALVREIEAVVFHAIDETERLEAQDFSALRAIRVASLQQQRHDLLDSIDQLSQAISNEDSLHEKVPQLRTQLSEKRSKRDQLNAELTRLTPSGKTDRVQRLAKVDAACQAGESAVQHTNLARQKLEDLRLEVKRLRSDLAKRFDDMKSNFATVGLSPDDWTRFGVQFSGDVDGAINERAKALDVELSRRMNGVAGHTVDVQGEPRADWPVSVLRQQRDALRKELSEDAARAKRMAEVTKLSGQLELDAKKLESQIEHDAGYEGRRRDLVRKRRDAYAEIFETLQAEQRSLEELYSPLESHLAAAGATPARIKFVVKRRVDLDAWVRRGERLLDLRTAGNLRGRGALKAAAESALLPAWTTGGSSEVATAMQGFLSSRQSDIKAGRPSSVADEHARAWMNDIARWLFSTEHIRLEYGIHYDGIEIERLSPGTRGIVLLTLYLAIDEWDHRPLLIDQPEENLDPKSIFDDLVSYFRAARSRRQVILVTHNANLVVNTDVDQVIVAAAERMSPTGLPRLSYESGGLEDPSIRKHVCALLEGGERAFLERERRYRLEGTARVT